MDLSDSSMFEGSELYAVKRQQRTNRIEHTLPISI